MILTDKKEKFGYVLITPVKNEADNLYIFANSVISQTIPPKVWVFVDGKSTDNTTDIIHNLINNYSWVYLKKQENFSDQGGHINFSLAMIEGYEFVKKLCDKKKISFNYVGKLDADVIVPPDFFEVLMNEFNKDKKLGVVSGVPYNVMKEKMGHGTEFDERYYKRDNRLKDELPDKRLYRKKFLDGIGGFPKSKFSPDTVLLAKCRIKGWKEKMVEKTAVYNLREDTGIEKRSWQAAILMGQSRYYLNYNPILFLLSTAYLLPKKPVSAIGSMFGYVIGFIKKKEQIPDKEIKEYFWNKRLFEVIKLTLKEEK